jgi:PAS domain S-box-containing protein
LELALWENVQDRHRFYADLSVHGSVDQQEFRFRRQDGSILIGLLSARLFTLEGEAMVLSVINDITEQRANERAQRLTQFLMEQTVDEIYFIREDATLQYVNEAACQRLGYSRDELLTMTVQDVDPNSSAASWGSHWQALKQTRSRTFETAHRTRSGRLYPVEVHVNYIEHEGVGYNCSICRDITERKRAEEALRASEENYRSLVETSDSAIAALNRDGQLLYANPVCLRIWEDPDLVGKTLYNLFPQEVADRFLTVIRRVIDEQIVDLNELQLTIRGAAMWFRVSMTPIKNSDGSVKALLLNAIDTTERKRTEAALAAAKEAAETANRAKSQFLANMSHELRTPLNAILGFSEIMAQDANLSADQQENLAIINRSGDHLLSLINDVLDMAKIEAGRTVLQEHTFDLHQLLADLRDMFRLRATAKGLALRVTWTADVPQFVCADASKLRQVLINLLSNAIKFTTTGSVTLTVAQMTAAAGDQLYFVVQDTGPGIPLEDQEAVFEPFVQSASGRLASEGTGLGLPISRQFVRLMGGELTVASAGAPGQGSCFTMALPLRVADNDGAPAQWLGGPHAIGPAPGQPDYRLLVAEDDAASRRLLAEMLTELGFTVRTATNGQEAIQVWAEWQPHMIWMDMRMPVMDGHAATRRIKETAQGQQTVIVAVSASVLDGQRTAVLAAGCDDFVAKPIRAEAVVAQLVKHLGVRFIYTEGAPTDGAASLAGASAFDLTALPTGWISQVRHAAVVADARRLHELAAELADAQPVLASALREWVADFDYAAVLLAVAHDPKEEHDGI